MIKNKQAITFLSGSAGELDWILPILDHLSKLDFKIKIIFLTRHVQQSVVKNSLLNDFINRPNNQIMAIECGGYFVELIEKFGYLMHRLNIKLKKPKLLSIFFYILENICEVVFKNSLPDDILVDEGETTLIFSESPSLRRPRDKWIKQNFKRSLFFYHPHSPHIYASDLDRNYQISENINFNKKQFLLVGSFADYFELGKDNEFFSDDLEKVITGHPKYSKRWLHASKQKAIAFRNSFAERDKTNILVISRGEGSYLNQDSQKYLVEKTAEVIEEKGIKYNLFVKKHPREANSHWDKIMSLYPSISVVEDHILEIASKVDFAITFWSSGAMDCVCLGVPVIEFYDPNRNPKQQILQGSTFTTIYRKLGVVYAADDKIELDRVVSGLLQRDHKMQLKKPHPFYIDLMEQSNLWEAKMEKILAANNLLKS